ncbi:metallopeptidase TldD-related protein [Actinoplanes siamensis]|uniref:Metalloprotease TldD/E C-terminal domain-containing protein n=1 Tax=Actinoplanes siamensis TaxID=1223317 RepID=A0A919N6T9_9ACTN|nr:metallopeptidase TldD-related protein [Actinoplanes siamensis]GIF05433.1 hypothetical protein Asi03nite_29710 [Actinoplanes siamensis]
MTVPFPSWDAVRLAREAVAAAAPAADEVELWVHDTAELSCSLLPATGALTTVHGGGWGYASRVWADGRCGWAARAVDDLDDLCRLIDQAHWTARDYGVPKQPPPVITVDTARRQPITSRLFADVVQSSATGLADKLTAIGAAVQAVIVNRYQTIAGLVTRSGADAAEYYSDERLMARCETPYGAVSDAQSRMALHGRIDDEPLVARVADALGALAGPGVAPPGDLPVVLRPAVAAPLAGALAWLLSGTTAIAYGGIAKALGRQLFPRCLRVDDPGTEQGEPLRTVDDEGYRVRPVELVADGRPVALLHSVDSARAMGHEPNGRGIRFGLPEQPIGQAIRMRIAGGRGVMPADHLELCCRIDNLNTMPVAGRLELIVAGWIVRGGRRIRRVAPFELNVDLLSALRLLIGTGDDAVRLVTAAEVTLPSLVLRRLP